MKIFRKKERRKQKYFLYSKKIQLKKMLNCFSKIVDY